MVYLCKVVIINPNTLPKHTQKNTNMKTSKLDTDVTNFVQSVKAATNKKEQITLTVGMRKALEQGLQDTTVRGYLTAYRKAVTLEFGETTHLLKYLRLPKAKGQRIKSKYQAEIQSRTENNELTPIPNHLELINFACSLLESESYLKVALGLMLVAGRRSIEILKTAKFTTVPRKSFEVVFEGQAKLKDKIEVPYTIPILAPAKAVIKALEYIREQKKEFATLTDKELNKKCGNSLNKTCKRLFELWLGGECSPHDLRKAYAAICYHNTNKKNSFRGFASKILGHNSDSDLTTETYFKYTI